MGRLTEVVGVVHARVHPLAGLWRMGVARVARDEDPLVDREPGRHTLADWHRATVSPSVRIRARRTQTDSLM